MTDWKKLNGALDAAARRGEIIRFWWRDDDAGKGSSALTRLLELADRQNLPLALAVVPAWIEAGAQAPIAASAESTVLQHGYAHINHGKKGAKSIELGSRPVAAIGKELQNGRAILEDAFGAAFLPILVPPWNRIDSALHPHLHTWGYAGLSVFGERTDPEISPGVSLINTHIDPVDWRGTRGFLGDDMMLGRLISHLNTDEPIGILSHHLVMDEACWSFLECLLATLARHPAARICPVSHLVTSLDLSDGQAA